MGLNVEQLVSWTRQGITVMPGANAFERGVGVQVFVHLQDLHDAGAEPSVLVAEYLRLPAWGVLQTPQACLRIGLPIARVDPTHIQYRSMVESICMPAIDNQRYFGTPRATWNPEDGEIHLHAVIRDHGQAPPVMRAQFIDGLRETIAMHYLVLFRIWQLKRRYELGPRVAAQEIEPVRRHVHELIGLRLDAVPGP